MSGEVEASYRPHTFEMFLVGKSSFIGKNVNSRLFLVFVYYSATLLNVRHADCGFYARP